MKLPSPLAVVLSLALLLAGCQSLSIDPDVQKLAPAALFDSEEEALPAPPAGWLQDFNDPLLTHWVERAMAQNFSLQEARSRVEAARQQRRIAGAPLWPTLDLGLDGRRQKTPDSADRYSNQFSVAADISWELDLWGRLSDTRDAAGYRWQAEQALYHSSRLSLAAQVARSWYQLAAQQQLTQLLQERVDNLGTNLDIIESGYRQGINSAIDVYLARSDLASEQSSLDQQRAQLAEAVRQLQLLLGSYPSGQLTDLDSDTPGQLPTLAPLDAEPINTTAVRHRFDIQASFLELMATDRELAAAHKARFPALRLSASSGDTSEEFSQLLDASSLAWNLLGNLSQPLFAGGRLQAREQQQLALVRQREQQYLNTLYTAFSEVEQAITNERALNSQLTQIGRARELAEAAEKLAFEEYRQGLQPYSAVLEAQRRAFGSQSSVIELRNQLLQNRINLLLALGGDYR